MKEKNWLELIEEKREEIMAKGVEAYESAWESQHMQFNVELYNDGVIEVWSDIAGGNSFKASNRNDTSMCLFTICHEHNEVEITEEQFKTALKEKGYKNLVIEIEDIASEEMSSFESMAMDKDYTHSEIVIPIHEELKEEYIEWDIEENARELLSVKLAQIEKELERDIEPPKKQYRKGAR
ncbi:MAG: hypothetical protein ACK5LL_13750 [Suipraeoptans sp.]